MIWFVILYIPHFIGGFVIRLKFPDQNCLCIFYFPIHITADPVCLIRMYLVTTHRVIWVLKASFRRQKMSLKRNECDLLLRNKHSGNITSTDIAKNAKLTLWLLLLLLLISK
jgi:hypothetical protein